jgi:MoaA/NifB/PqqE/SkfB family radical SAM enzyme
MVLSSLRTAIIIEIRTVGRDQLISLGFTADTIKPMHPEGLDLFDHNGNERGFVDPKYHDYRPVLEDLWVMQGSICDLRCKHCYTASSPTNHRLQQIASAELRPHLEDAERFGIQKIFFTGGEVFVNEDILQGRAERNEEFLSSLRLALEIAPVEILTNGRRYIRNHFAALRELQERFPGRLTLRITLESPHELEHDAIRGRTTFAQTVETVRELGEMGFVPVITAERPLLNEHHSEAIRQAYAALFPGMRIEVNLIENMLEMGHHLVRMAADGHRPTPGVFVTTKCFGILGRSPESLMCHFSRCIQKIDGRLRYYPCPVIYDDERFELGSTLEESFRRVYVGHKNCYDYCLKGSGASCRTHAI